MALLRTVDRGLIMLIEPIQCWLLASQYYKKHVQVARCKGKQHLNSSDLIADGGDKIQVFVDEEEASGATSATWTDPTLSFFDLGRRGKNFS